MLFAVAALFFSAPQGAFAHGNHHHAQQTQNAPMPSLDRNALIEMDVQHFAQSVSAADEIAGECPHGQKQTDCGFCCACAGGASVALATPELAGRSLHSRSERNWLAVPYEIRQAVLDLSRPPKTFA